MGMKKRKRASKKNLLTISERKAQKRAQQDCDRLKRRLRSLVNKTKVVWNGKPYSTDSTYDLQIHPELVRFFLNLFDSHQSEQVDRATLEAAKAVSDLNKKDFTDLDQEGNIEDKEEEGE